MPPFVRTGARAESRRQQMADVANVIPHDRVPWPTVDQIVEVQSVSSQTKCADFAQK